MSKWPSYQEGEFTWTLLAPNTMRKTLLQDQRYSPGGQQRIRADDDRGIESPPVPESAPTRAAMRKLNGIAKRKVTLMKPAGRVQAGQVEAGCCLPAMLKGR